MPAPRRPAVPAPDAALALQRLWDEHRRIPFPAADAGSTPQLQEIALFESWLGAIIDATIAGGGRLSAAHEAMLETRRAEGGQALWAAAAGQPEHVRSYVARLLALEEMLQALPIR